MSNEVYSVVETSDSTLISFPDLGAAVRRDYARPAKLRIARWRLCLTTEWTLNGGVAAFFVLPFGQDGDVPTQSAFNY